MFPRRTEAVFGVLLILLGLAILASNLEFLDIGAHAIGVLFFAALGFFLFTTGRSADENWWATVLSGVAFGLAAVVLLDSIEGVPPGVSRAVFLWSWAIPFVALYRRSGKFFWASIPGGLLILLGLIALGSGTTVGAALLAWLLYWGVAAAFGALFLKDPTRWWTLVPGGVFFSLGLTTLLGKTGLAGANAQGFIFNLCLAGTFAFLYLIRNEKNKLDWAKIPAVILLVISVLFLFSALSWGLIVKIVSVGLLLAGFYLLLSGRRSKQDGVQDQ